MRRIVVLAACAALAVPIVPAFAGSDVNAPCAAVPGTTVLKAGTPFTGTMTQPSFLVGNEEESRTFILDMSGLPKDSVATVSADLSWTIRANDFDLHLTAGDDDVMTNGYQPIDDAVESASAGNVSNCGEITVGVADFLAPVVAGDTITLNLGVSVY